VITITLQQHDLHLLPGRAVWRPKTRTLYVADLHIGKTSAFAKGGIPLSAQVLERTTVNDLARLSSLMLATGALRLIILGDLLHATAGRDPRTLALLSGWRNAHVSVEVLLIRGNHDHAAGDPPDSSGIRCVDAPFDDDGLTLLHYPTDPPTCTPTLAGHLHPAVKLSAAGGGDQARVACFWVSGGQIVLPAFGGFTGAASIAPRPGDRVFAVADDAVCEVPVVSVKTGLRIGRSVR